MRYLIFEDSKEEEEGMLTFLPLNKESSPIRQRGQQYAFLTGNLPHFFYKNLIIKNVKIGSVLSKQTLIIPTFDNISSANIVFKFKIFKFYKNIYQGMIGMDYHLIQLQNIMIFGDYLYIHIVLVIIILKMLQLIMEKLTYLYKIILKIS